MQNDKTQSPSFKENYFHKYFQYSSLIISSYKGNEPFHIFLKKYFSLNKKHGSKDRKIISSLCYNYFRLGFGVSSQIDQTEKFLSATFLCERNGSLLLEYYKPEWNAAVHLSLNEKLEIVQKEFTLEKICPFIDELGNEINSLKFNLSFLIQPKLFIRIRPGFKNSILDKIKSADFSFQSLSNDCISFAKNEKVNSIIDLDKEAVIQDYNSQQTLDLLKPLSIDAGSEINIWDCCAGSGGKSILAFDVLKNIKLTISDKRRSIIKNLKLRFHKAGIINYNFICADLQKPITEIDVLFDIIIADVPCSGSGTWSRTPEQLNFFSKNNIEKYSSLQRSIIENALPHLNPNGFLLYITCSVFKKENEDNAAYFKNKFQMDLIEMKYLEGYEMQADTLFVALFKKNNSL